MHGRCMGDVWEIYERCMGDIWEIYGEIYGRYTTKMAGSSRLRQVGTMPAPMPDMKNSTCLVSRVRVWVRVRFRVRLT